MTSNRRSARPVRVLIVEDHDLYAQTLRLLLETNDRIEVVARAADGSKGVELALELRPDVVLMDVAMPVMDGIEATRAIREQLPSTRIVVLSSSPAADDVRHAFEAGAEAYLTKE